MTALIASLLGGIGLFLLGMWLMTGGLRLAAGAALQTILDRWTRSALRGFIAGFLMTAIVQSSSAATVATVGFVNAGLLTLRQAVWVVIGANVGTTMTGWIVALVGIKIDIGAIATPLVGIGMLLHLAGRRRPRLAGLGQAFAGFGAFFLGIDVLQESFAALAPQLTGLDLNDYTWITLLGFLGLGTLVTVLTQSSSAAIAITLTASATGSIPLPLAAAAVIGTNIGTTSTALFAALGATAAARRVALAHILFNLFAGAAALILLQPLLWLSETLAADVLASRDLPTILAVFHTLFNFAGALLVWPIAGRLMTFLGRRFVSAAERLATPRYLDATLAGVPQLALKALAMELSRLAAMAYAAASAVIAGDDALSRPKRDEERVGLLQLGRHVLQFIARLGTGAGDGEPADALPDLIRATQHLDDLIATSHALAELAPVKTPVKDIQWQTLRDAAAACLARDVDGRPLFPPAAETTSLSLRVDEAYQAIKKDLLHATARGRLAVDDMEKALARAQLIRRCAELALKASRRLAPWAGRVETES
jgi:phosphate:Na+ symporter